MDNPFLKRATEFLRDDEAFLAIVAPEPVTFFLKKPARAGSLYDRLVHLRGTPGSGKTTLARLFEYPTLATLLRMGGQPAYKDLVAAMTECGAIVDERPAFVGCRLPLETDYRDFWEFPYPDTLKLGLMTAMIQARAVLAWLRHVSQSEQDSCEVRIVPRPGAEGILDSIGGCDGRQVGARARQVEAALYEIMNALIAPDVSKLSPAATTAYQPFDIIDHICVTSGPENAKRTLTLRPLAILDDAHVLHPEQFRALERWLLRRELRVARWLISRFDVLLPREALTTLAADRSSSVDLPGHSAQRDTEVILLQSGPRREQRRGFRRMAKDMATRYLSRMPLLSTRNLTALGDLLAAEEQPISPSKLGNLKSAVNSTQRRFAIRDEKREDYWKSIQAFRAGGSPVAEDIALAMLDIMLHRHHKRLPAQQLSLFDSADDIEPSRRVVANQSVCEAARLHLLDKYGRPYFYGIDDLCDASCENAELFLRLAATLVETIATQVIRSRQPNLTAPMQHKLLRQRGDEIIQAWNFPEHEHVRRLVVAIAERCREVSLEPNGWLTPNGYGILQDEFESLAENHPELARVLHFAVAYNAITLVPQYPCKKKTWCLLELGGMVILKHGLTLKRGGFIEGSAGELAGLMQGPQQ